MMRIQADGAYKARNGEKIGPLKPFNNRGFIVNIGDGHRWDTDGLGWFKGRLCSDWDLIAEWTDGPVVTETVTKTRIVPGTYDGVSVEVPAPYGEFLVSWCKHDPTPDQLDAAAVVLSALAKGLRDA